MTRPRIYLAGPDVFLSNAAAFFEAKRKLCDAYGFTGVSPFDNEIDLTKFSKHEAALGISAANEAMIRECDLVIANMTPFRGPSADVGTAYEMGFARALGMPVFAYTTVAGSLLDRTVKELGLPFVKRENRVEDSYRMVIEDFGCVDNLMLVGAVEASGVGIVVSSVADEGQRFTDLKGFEECLRLAKQQLGLSQHGHAGRWQASG